MIDPNNAYLQSPSLRGEWITFLCDDDIWLVSTLGGTAKRLTNSKGLCESPFFSPDGEKIAFVSNESGQKDIYLIDRDGSVPERITFCGVRALRGWTNKNTLQFTSAHNSFNQRVTYIYEMNLQKKVATKVNLGHASVLVKSGQLSVLGKNLGDPARWKRYRGGTAGTLWVNTKSTKKFKKLLPKIKSNFANPMLINERIFFISDHEGIGNIYSTTSTGKSVERHTDSDTYYVRNFSYDQGLLCYQSGADIYLKELKGKKAHKVEIKIPSSFNQSTPRLVEAEDYLQEFALQDGADNLAVLSRGRIFIRKPWASSPFSIGELNYRYKEIQFLESYKDKDKDRYLFAVELNRENEESLILFNITKPGISDEIYHLGGKTKWGKINAVIKNPAKNMIAVSSNRNELHIVHYPNGRVEKVAKGEFALLKAGNWSPCGRYFAYSIHDSRTQENLYIYDTKTKKSRRLFDSVLNDFSPCFSDDGNYLFFLGVRNFNPIYNESHFDLGFPMAVGVYAVPLTKKVASPLSLFENFENESDEEEEDLGPKKAKGKETVSSAKKQTAAKEKEKEKESETEIDFDRLEERIIALPLTLGGYLDLQFASDKLFILRHPISSKDGDFTSMRMPGFTPNLYTYCLKEKKYELYQKSCSGFEISGDGGYILLDSEDDLRLLATDGRPTEGSEVNKKDGHLDLGNIQFHFDPKKEWVQMFQEAWILQRENFWSEDMNKIDWQKVFKDYKVLLEKVNTRKEFSDLMWEMQGELGTSHCYEFGGDYDRHPKREGVASLGCELIWNQANHSYKIEDLCKGDNWITGVKSPLRAPQVCLDNGDLITGIDGRPFTHQEEIFERLQGRSQSKINLLVKRKGKREKEIVEVQPVDSCHLARYRDWVDQNKAYVHKMSKGKLGYVHIPDMGLHGYSEFYRNFLTEVTKEGLIVDVRYNGGGHISQHILKILQQKTVGFDQTRYYGVEPYPAYSVNGPIVAITNEHAGSDGDIFSHSFKLMGIGPLIGTRTWGGVVGIWPRFALNDGTMTSQPEFSFWFKDVGYDVENYGTDPDIEVEIMPEDWAKGIDSQLDRAIKEAEAMKKKSPPLKSNLAKGRPNLKAPKLPKY